MAVYLVTGKLGSGKSLISVGRAVEYASKGRRVAANFSIDFSQVKHSRRGKLSEAYCEVLPARPSANDLHALGRGGDREEVAGLLILDEAATYLNARDWADKDRKRVIDWFLHSRKLGWDVMLICQHQSLLDKQIRESVCEMLVTCSRLDRLNVPVISWIFPVKLPRVHVAKVRYGLSPSDLKAESWTYRGNDLFAAYATTEIFAEMDAGSYCVLPSRLSKWRYEPPAFDLKKWLSYQWNKPAQISLPRPEPKPKSRLVALLEKLPPDDRERHWLRLSELGAI
jgi:hypothetical protein